MSNQTAAAVAVIANSVNWERKGLDLQAIIEAGNQGKLGKPLTDWLVSRGWDSDQGQEASAPESEIDTIIHIDRSIRPSYPDWVKMVMHPELENTGPTEYDITKLKLWLHDGQKDGKCIEGNKIYAHLKDTGDLKNHCGLRDLEEIQKKGLAFFRKHFRGKAVFAWQGVVRGHSGGRSVPYLCEGGGGVVLRWGWLGTDWYSNNPGLRHAS